MKDFMMNRVIPFLIVGAVMCASFYFIIEADHKTNVIQLHPDSLDYEEALCKK